MAVSGLSTLNMRLAYGAYSSNTSLPASVTAMGRINSIGEIALSQESIDASAIEDTVTQYVEGRSDTGGEWTVTVNITDETVQEWEAIKGTTQWFEVYHPNLSKAWFIAAAVPARLPLSAVDQNGLLTMEISLVCKFYHGLDTKIAPSGGGVTT